MGVLIISQKIENVGDIMFLSAPPPPSPPSHANACTGHNCVTHTPILDLIEMAPFVYPKYSVNPFGHYMNTPYTDHPATDQSGYLPLPLQHNINISINRLHISKHQGKR